MATVIFSSVGQPQDEARVIIEALTAWLAEQPDRPPCGGEVELSYDGDGYLRTLTVLMDSFGKTK